MLACRLHYCCPTKQDWLPGVAGTQPRLEFRLWGVSSKEGACTSPLFYFSQWLVASRGWSQVFQRRRASVLRLCSFSDQFRVTSSRRDSPSVLPCNVDV